MSTTRASIKLTHAALDDEKGEIILRGVIDPSSLHLLKAAPYQREVLPLATINKLQAAFKKGSAIPDIDLGMRGGSFTERDGAFYLQDEVFIIDGLQRQTAALEAMREAVNPRLGATVHFNTTEEWERSRFRILNMMRVKLSPNILIRNMRQDSPAVEMLYNLSNDTSFTLYHKIGWSQRIHREQLVTALAFLKSTGALHSNFGFGMLTSKYEDVAANLSKLLKTHNRNVIRNNIKIFWETMDDIWGVKTVAFKEGAVYLRANFVYTLAEIFAEHENFWRDNVLTVDRKLKTKIKLFPLTDPNIANLIGSGGASRKLLYRMIVDHINSGKRTMRLIPTRRRYEMDEEDEAPVKSKLVRTLTSGTETVILEGVAS